MHSNILYINDNINDNDDYDINIGNNKKNIIFFYIYYNDTTINNILGEVFKECTLYLLYYICTSETMFSKFVIVLLKNLVFLSVISHKSSHHSSIACHKLLGISLEERKKAQAKHIS